jgi:hypothetical protein
VIGAARLIETVFGWTGLDQNISADAERDYTIGSLHERGGKFEMLTPTPAAIVWVAGHKQQVQNISCA